MENLDNYDNVNSTNTVPSKPNLEKSPPIFIFIPFKWHQEVDSLLQ